MRWVWIILLALIVTPVVEVAIMTAVAQQIGVVWVLLLSVATMILGGSVLRAESMRSLQRLRQTMETGQVPGTESSHGGLRMLGGIALLVPGFVTDALGLLLLLPPVRTAVRALMLRGLVRRMSPEDANRLFGPRRVRAKRGRPQTPPRAAEADDTHDVIDGEVLEGEIVEPREPGTDGPEDAPRPGAG
ncbi:MAG: FxsA family protein [Micromonosporaceae bacterium]|nr:FxsA family protein [Micromonosporaceae bacterium]